MDRIRPILSFIVLILFGFSHLAAMDWQGMAGRSATADFPGNGYYAASNTFAKNTLVDVTNPANGKTIRVIVVSELGKSSLFLSLSAQAAEALGVPTGQTVTVRAAQVPSPSALGSSYADESNYGRDPDLYTPATTNPNTTGVAGADRPADTTANNTTANNTTANNTTANNTTPTVNPVTPTNPNTATVAETKPESSLPNTSKPLSGTTTTKPNNVLPKPTTPEQTPNTTVVNGTTKPRTWVGVKNGVDEAAKTPIRSGSVGAMNTPTTSPTVATPNPDTTPSTAAQNAKGTGLAQGLNSYNGRNLINPGDVSRPEQSIWLSQTNKPKTNADSRLRIPAVASDSGPESLRSTKPSSPNTAIANANLSTPAVKDSASVANPVAAQNLNYSTGPGLYGKQLADARGRAVANLGGNGIARADDPEWLNSASAKAGANLASGTLPAAKLASVDKPEASIPYLKGLDGTMAAGTLPEALVANEARAEAGLAAKDQAIAKLETDLPLAKMPNPDKAEGSLVLRAETPTLASAILPETRPKSDEKPETPVPRGFADSVILSFEPADYRPPKLPATDSAEGTLAGTSPTGVPIAANLKDPALPATDSAEGNLAGTSPTGVPIAANLKDPNLPATDSAEGNLAGTSPTGVPIAANLKDPALPATDSAEGNLANGQPGASTLTGPLGDPKTNPAESSLTGKQPSSNPTIAANLKDPSLPSTSSAEGALATATPGTTPVDGQLAKPGTTADTGAVATKPTKDPRLDSVLAFLEPAEARPPQTGTTTSPTISTKPTDKPADKPADKPVDKTNTTVVDKPVDKPTDKPTTVVIADKPTTPSNTATNTTVPISITQGFKDADWAKSNLNMVATLQSSKYYVQMGSYADPKTAAIAIKAIAKGYPIVVLPETQAGRGLYKVFAGPLREDEKGITLTMFRSKGFKDAFVRSGSL